MELAYAGYFSKVHGVKGQLILRMEYAFLTEDINALFIETAAGRAPHFITEIKDTKNGLIISLEEVDSVEKARLLTGKKVYVDVKFLDKEEEDFDWLSYELIDKHHGNLGKILEVTDNGAQVLLTVNFNGKEIILPLVEDFIEKVDETAKKLFFNSPEGLIQLYLEEDEKDF